MKWIFIFLALACAAGNACADLVIQQQITTPNYNGVVTMKIKGTKVRTDMYSGQPQAISSIVDLDTGEVIMLLHKQQMYLKTKQSKSSGAFPSPPTPQPTGKYQKVGDYDTELYMWTNSRGITGTVWVAKNYPDYARIRADYTTLDKTTGMDREMTPALSTLPGMAVRSQVTGGGQTIILALISAKEGPVDTSAFRIPHDYKEVPKLKPVKQVTSPPVPSNAPGASTPKAPGTTSPKTANAPKLPPW